MNECWAGSPQDRPLLGDVEPRLAAILKRYRDAPAPNESSPRKNRFNSFPHVHVHTPQRNTPAPAREANCNALARAKPSLPARLSMVYHFPDARLADAHWAPEY